MVVDNFMVVTEGHIVIKHSSRAIISLPISKTILAHKLSSQNKLNVFNMNPTIFSGFLTI